MAAKATIECTLCEHSIVAIGTAIFWGLQEKKRIAKLGDAAPFGAVYHPVSDGNAADPRDRGKDDRSKCGSCTAGNRGVPVHPFIAASTA